MKQNEQITMSELSKILKKNYKPLCQEEQLDYTYMNTILDYLTIDILTMYENNIKQHYIEYVERYVNVVWRKNEMIKLIRKFKNTKREREETINKLCSELRKIKNDLLSIDDSDYKSNKRYHNWIDCMKSKIKPSKKKFKKDNLYYDLQCNPQDYFECMIFMMKEVEKNKYSVNNVFPLRNDIQPKHIRLDTSTLVHLLFTKKQGNKSNYLFKGNLKRYEDKIWEFFFRTEL